jgi:hypothetical protein
MMPQSQTCAALQVWMRSACCRCWRRLLCMAATMLCGKGAQELHTGTLAR